MFGLRKKQGNSNNSFGDQNYQMKDQFQANDLVVARFERVSSAFTDCGPMVEETKQKYIFEKINDEGRKRYREVFTGFMADDYELYFNLPYVVDVQPFTYYFPETKDIAIPKLSLIWTLNDINFRKVKTVKVRVIKK